MSELRRAQRRFPARTFRRCPVRQRRGMCLPSTNNHVSFTLFDVFLLVQSAFSVIFPLLDCNYCMFLRMQWSFFLLCNTEVQAGHRLEYDTKKNHWCQKAIAEEVGWVWECPLVKWCLTSLLSKRCQWLQEFIFCFFERSRESLDQGWIRGWRWGGQSVPRPLSPLVPAPE